MSLRQSFVLIKQGAEARIYRGEYFGAPAILKERFKKTYRHRELDNLISKERLKAEGKGMLRCRLAGVLAPTVYHVDIDTCCIYEQLVEGPTAKELINKLTSSDKSEEKVKLHQLAKIIGTNIGRIHKIGLIHGDLTTSNMIFTNEEKLYLIDFGLSCFSHKPEDKAVDLYVLERAIASTHLLYEDIFFNILEGYQNSSTDIKEVMKKYEEVKARGRKRTMVG